MKETAIKCHEIDIFAFKVYSRIAKYQVDFDAVINFTLCCEKKTSSAVVWVSNFITLTPLTCQDDKRENDSMMGSWVTVKMLHFKNRCQLVALINAPWATHEMWINTMHRWNIRSWESE